MLKRLIQVTKRLIVRNKAESPEPPTFADELACALAILPSTEVRALYLTLGADPAVIETKIRSLREQTPGEGQTQRCKPGEDWSQHLANVAPSLSTEIQLLAHLCVRGSVAIKQALAPVSRSPGDLTFLIARKSPEADLRSLWPPIEEQTGKVVLLNDHFTPMEFVVGAIEVAFGISHERAITQMLEIHHTGTSVFGTNLPNNATDICSRLNHEWREQGFSLYCVPERADRGQSDA